jgi:SAM-dependent methyltransferase
MTAYRPYVGELARDYATAAWGASPFSWLLAIQEDFVLDLAPPEMASALDIGCGAGSLAARLVSGGLREVVGLDVSDEQIEICRNSVSGAEFIVGDCRDIGRNNLQALAHRFQFVNASWIFDSATSVDDLHTLARGIAASVASPGVHTGICLSPYIRPSLSHEWDSYGIALMEGLEPSEQPVDGRIVFGRLALEDTSAPHSQVGTLLAARYFKHSTYDSALRSAGFKDIEYFRAEDWLSSLSARPNRDYSNFRKYSAENPEMMAYRAFI